MIHNQIHQNGIFTLLSSGSNATPMSREVDPYLKSSDSNFNTNDSLDVFICGRCSYQFKDMCQFMTHKQSCYGRSIAAPQMDTQQGPYNHHDRHHQGTSLNVMMGSGMSREPVLPHKSNGHQDYSHSTLDQLNMDTDCDNGLQPGALTRQLLVDRNTNTVPGIADISMTSGDNFLEVPTTNDETLLFGEDRDNEVFNFFQPPSNQVYDNHPSKTVNNLQPINQSMVQTKAPELSHHYEAHSQQNIVDPSLQYPVPQNNLQRSQENYLNQNNSYDHSYHSNQNNYQNSSHHDYHEMLPPSGLPDSSFANDLLSAAPLPNNIVPDGYYQHQQSYHQPHENYLSVMQTDHSSGYLPPINEIPIIGNTSADSHASTQVNASDITNADIKNQTQVFSSGPSEINGCHLPHTNKFDNTNAPLVNSSLDHENQETSTETITPAVNKKPMPVLYKCHYCSRGFTKNFDLEQHVRVHTGEKPYQCIVCGRAFSQRSNVKKHMRSHKVWPSEISSLPSVHTIGVRLDANKQLIIRPTKSIDSVVEKREYRLLNNPNCTGSGQQTTEEPIVLVDNSFECRFCKQRFQDYYRLRSHMRKHKDQQVYLCVLSSCKRTFRELTAFLEHLEEHKRDREMIYACYMCTQQFSSLYQLGEHYNQHRDATNSLSCPGCKKSYLSVTNLQQHLSVCSHCHTCSHCDKGFSTEFALRRHIAIHATIPQFQCPFCTRSFKTKGYLNFHLRSHQNGFPYNCSVCNKGFQRKDKLRTHESLHCTDHDPTSGFQNHQHRLRCPLHQVSGCSFSCARKDTLLHHLSGHWRWVHRPAACALCNYRFTSFRNLRSHRCLHRKSGAVKAQNPSTTDNVDLDNTTGDNSMVCSLCRRQFQRKTPFVNHMIMCKQKLERNEILRIRRLTHSSKKLKAATTLESTSSSINQHPHQSLVTEATNVAHHQIKQEGKQAGDDKLEQTKGTSPANQPDLPRSSRRSKFTTLWKPKRTRTNQKPHRHGNNHPLAAAHVSTSTDAAQSTIGISGRITTLVVKGNQLIGCSSSVVDHRSPSMKRTFVHHGFLHHPHEEGGPVPPISSPVAIVTASPASAYQLPPSTAIATGNGGQQQTLPSIATLNPLNFSVTNDTETSFFSEPLSFLQSLDTLGPNS